MCFMGRFTPRNYPMVDDIKAEFKDDNAKLFWPVSIDGKKLESETYKIIGVVERLEPAP